MTQKSSVLVTGASSGIGAAYADRFARRGHDVVLVARDAARLAELAERLRRDHGIAAEALPADLTNPADLGRIETRARDDRRIGILVNNAGAVGPGGFLDQDPDGIANIIALNVTAVTRLARAVAARFAAEGRGAIINIGSVVGFAPEVGMSVYGATKAFVLFLSQGLHLELGAKGVHVQAVLPAAVRTEIWQRSGRDVDALQSVMSVDDLVDAALVGFDRGETVTIPPLPDEALWIAFERARGAMRENFFQALPAERYRARAADAAQ